MKTIALFVVFLAYVLQANAQTRHEKPPDEHRRKASIDHAIRNNLPLCFVEARLEYDTALLPVLKLFAQNVTKKVIHTYTIEVHCYDEHSAPVRHETKNTGLFVGNSESLTPSLQDVYFPDIFILEGFKNTTRVKIYLAGIQFWDGTSWTPTNKAITLIEAWNRMKRKAMSYY